MIYEAKKEKKMISRQGKSKLPFLNKPGETWENRNAGIISLNPRATSIFEMKVALQKRGWRGFSEGLESTAKLFAACRTGEVNLIIVDDSARFSALELSRRTMFDVVGSCLPMLVIANDQDGSNTATFGKSMDATEFVERPFSTSSFLRGFDSITQRWSDGYLATIRQAGEFYVKNDLKRFMKELFLLVGQNVKTPRAYTALATAYRQRENFEMAEKILERGVMACGGIETLIPLIDLYLSTARPERAEQLARKAYATNEAATFLCLDIIQALLMQGKVEDSVPFLKKLVDHEYFGEAAKEFLPRVYYALGHRELFDEAIKLSPVKFDDYQKAWHKLSDEEAKKRRIAYIERKKQARLLLREQVKEKMRQNRRNGKIQGRPGVAGKK